MPLARWMLVCFIERIQVQARGTVSTVRALARRFLAGVLALLLLAAATVSVSRALHRALHGSASTHPHFCLCAPSPRGNWTWRMWRWFPLCSCSALCWAPVLPILPSYPAPIIASPSAALRQGIELGRFGFVFVTEYLARPCCRDARQLWSGHETRKIGNHWFI